MTKGTTKAQSQYLYFIELDGGMMSTPQELGQYTTLRGRHIPAKVARDLIGGDHLIAHQDSLNLGDRVMQTQTWEVKHKIGVERREG